MLVATEALSRKRLASLVALLVVVKAALVLSLADVFFWLEELEKGAAAKAMLDGLAVPHHQLAYHYYEGGGFVVSHLTALAYLLVGQNLLALKLVPLAFQVAILVAGCRFTGALFGPRAALWFGLLFVFGPGSYQKLGLLDVGVHFEACLFLLLVLGLGARILLGNDRRTRTWGLLGLATGFGVFFSYQVVLAAAWVGLLLLSLQPREVFGRRGLAGLVGTALGALPLIAMYVLVGGAVFDIHGTAVLSGVEGPSNSVLFREYLGSIFVEGPAGERLTALAWVLYFLTTLGFAFRRRRSMPLPGERSPRRGALFVLGYLTLFLVVYLSSGFVQGSAYHYFISSRLVPVWLFAAVVIAGVLGQLTDSPLPELRRLGLVLGALLVALGVRASLVAIGGGRPAELGRNVSELTHQKGYAYAQYLAKVLPHFEGDRRAKLELVEDYAEPARALLRADAVAALYTEEFLAEETDGPLAAHARALAELRRIAAGDEERLDAYRLGLGPLLVIALGWNREALLDSLAGAPAPERAALMEAVGRVGAGDFGAAELLRREVERAARHPGSEPYLRGLGRWTFRLHRRLGVEALLMEYPEPVARPLREGFEAERAWHLLP